MCSTSYNNDQRFDIFLQQWQKLRCTFCIRITTTKIKASMFPYNHDKIFDVFLQQRQKIQCILITVTIVSMYSYNHDKSFDVFLQQWQEFRLQQWQKLRCIRNTTIIRFIFQNNNNCKSFNAFLPTTTRASKYFYNKLLELQYRFKTMAIYSIHSYHNDNIFLQQW